MGIRPFRAIPQTVREWEEFFSGTNVAPTPGTVTDGSFANRTPNSVLGRATGTVGAPGDITLSANQFLVNRSGTLQGGTIVDADIPSAIARDTEVTNGDNAVTAAFQAADAAHLAAGDPHPQYLTAAEGNAAYQPLAAVLSLLHTGTGSPEGVLTATVGHLYLRSDGGASTTLYVKESGSGNTGWVGK